MIKTKIEIATDYLRAFPFSSNSETAIACNVSKRTARRARALLKKNVGAKVLLFDIETAPMEIFVWALYKQKPSSDNVIKEWSCLSWAAKWLFEENVMSKAVNGKEAINREDKRIIKGIWKLFDRADIVVAHNAKKFDVRKLNARFVLNGLLPPSPYQTVDTLKESQKHFAMSSHRLDDLAKAFKKPQKTKVEYSLWKRCVSGDEQALKEMQRYNENDVLVLEEIYVKLRPWIKSHPNLGLYMNDDETVCPNCGSGDLVASDTPYYTPVGRYQTLRCVCGAIGRSRFTSVDRKKNSNLIAPIAR